MNTPALRLLAFSSVAVLSGCVNSPFSEFNRAPVPEKPAMVYDSSVHVQAQFLTYAQLRVLAESNTELNDRLLQVAPTMAYRPGEAQPDAAPAADNATFAAHWVPNWIGDAIDAGSRKQTAEFAAFNQEPDSWLNNHPLYAAVELMRCKGEGSQKEKLFDAIVLIRPVMSADAGQSSIPTAYQLVPVYLLETTPAAIDPSPTMAALISVRIENTWTTASGDPAHVVAIDYSTSVRAYQLEQPFVFAASNDAADAATAKQVVASPFFAMPAHPATISCTFGVAEVDPSKHPALLEQLAEAVAARAADAGAPVGTKAAPSH